MANEVICGTVTARGSEGDLLAAVHPAARALGKSVDVRPELLRAINRELRVIKLALYLRLIFLHLKRLRLQVLCLRLTLLGYLLGVRCNPLDVAYLVLVLTVASQL